ncbi:MAG TPA: hypothetical protein VK277_09305 [Acidimicrobiales bacterium]|nr:hypothetical protein [Acidimicrobiales bacterium]
MAQAVIDCDNHLFESRDLWAEHIDPALRHLALRIEDDDRGHAWLTFGGQPIHLAEVHTPGRVAPMGEYRARVRAGLPPEVPYDEALPPHYGEPSARVTKLKEQGIDGAVVFPHYGLFWLRTLEAHREAQLANLSAWNRWAVSVRAEGHGHLYPVGHVSLRDLDWLRRELAGLAAGGVRLAMMPPTPVDGRPLSDPSLDEAWSAFVDSGISPMFHISDFARPFDDAWYEGDANPIEPLFMSVFISTPPTVALSDMATNGVFERHPELRLGLVEFTSSWLVPFLRALDVSYEFHGSYNGLPTDRLSLRPSEYIRRQVRAATFGFEHPTALADKVGDLFMFGSDYPHAEGSAHPLEDFSASGGPAPSDDTAGLYHDNVAWLLGEPPG